MHLFLCKLLFLWPQRHCSRALRRALLMPSVLECRGMRHWWVWYRRFQFSSAHSSSVLGGSVSVVVLTSVEFSRLLCSHVWEQQPAHESCLWGPISGLKTSDWKHFEARTRINSFIVGFLFYLRIAEPQLLLEAFVGQKIWFIHRLDACGHTGIIFSFEAVRRKSCCSDWQNTTSLFNWVVKRILFMCVLVLGKGGCILMSFYYKITTFTRAEHCKKESFPMVSYSSEWSAQK